MRRWRNRGTEKDKKGKEKRKNNLKRIKQEFKEENTMHNVKRVADE